MYDGIDGSPKTTILEQFIPGTSTEIIINNADYLPNAPNLCTITTSINNSNWYLVIKYETKTNNILSDLTVLYGNPSNSIICPKGSFCFRGYNEYDQNTFIYNINMIYQLLKDSSETIKPQILSFNISDLPTILPIGTSYVGTHTFEHYESFILYIWDTLKIYEDNIEIGSTNPAETSTTSTFTSAKIFNETGLHTYKLTGVDSFNRSFEYIQSVNIVLPMYYGTIQSDTINTTNFDLLTESNDFYSGITISIDSIDNDYIWICILNTNMITSITSDGFNVPIENPVILTKTINNVDITFNCYRLSSQVIAGTNTFTVNYI